MTDLHAKVSQRGILDIARGRTFARNSFLFYADSAADVGYLIRSGQVRCFVIDADGHETTTAILGSGQFVGTEVLTGHAAHAEFCEALTRVEAWALATDELHQSSTNSSAIQAWILGSVGKRLELALTLRRDIALLSAPDRVADIRRRLPSLAGVDARTVRQTSLASLLQIRPETLARARRPEYGTDSEEPWDGELLGVGRHDFGARRSVLHGHLPDGCIGRVVSGRAELSLTASESRAVVVETLSPGDLFGFGSLLELPALSYRIAGFAEGAIDVVPAAEFLRTLAASTTTFEPIVVRLATRLQFLERQLAASALPDASGRLARMLRDVSRNNAVAAGECARYVPASWSHIALARHLGVCRETVTRGLAALVQAGVITRQGRRIVVLSEDAGPREPQQPQQSRALQVAVRDADDDRARVLNSVDRHHISAALQSLRAVRSTVGEQVLIEALMMEVDRISGNPRATFG